MATHKLKNGAPAHTLTPEERAKGVASAAVKKREQSMTLRERIAKKLDEQADELIANTIRLSKKDGRLFIALVEQAHGRAPQSVELTGRDGGPIQSVSIPLEKLDAARRILEEATSGADVAEPPVDPVHPAQP